MGARGVTEVGQSIFTFLLKRDDHDDRQPIDDTRVSTDADR